MPRKFTQNGYLYTRDIKHKGKGVFSSRDIVAGEVVEVAPVIEISIEEVGTNVLLNSYIFEGYYEDCVFIGLGYASLYNHDKDSNAQFTILKNSIKIVAQRDIPKNTEITITYQSGGNIVFFDDGSWEITDIEENK